jgi:hypothetical protein
MIPAGWHTAKIVDHGISPGKKGSQVVVQFDCEAGIILGYFSLTDKSAEYTVNKIRAMGFQGDDLQQLNDGECIKGNLCEIQINHETFEGVERAKVGFVNPYGQQGGVRHDDEAAANVVRFNALLKKEPKVDISDMPAADDLPF